MKASPVKYRYKGAEQVRWVVRWQAEGRRPAKVFRTKREAEEWIRLQKLLSEQMSRQEIAEWNRIPAGERRLILAARKALLDAKMTVEVLPAAVARHIERESATENTLLFRDVARAFVEGKMKRLTKGVISEGYYGVVRGRMRKLSEEFGDRRIVDLTPDDLEAWLDECEAPKTFNDYRDLLSEMYAGLQRDYPTLKNPLLKIENYSIKECDDPVPAPSMVKEVLVRAMKSGNFPLLAGLVAGFGLGIRIAEITRLGWENVSREWVRLPAAITKSGDKRTIERCAAFAPILDTLMETKGEGGVVPRKWGLPRLQLLKEAGFTRTRNIMRRSFISYYVAVAPNVEAVRKVVGHSTTSRILETNYKALDLYDESGKRRPLMQQDALDYFALFEDVRLAVLAAKAQAGS